MVFGQNDLGNFHRGSIRQRLYRKQSTDHDRAPKQLLQVDRTIHKIFAHLDLFCP
jgi:hypothetical protein